MSTATNPARSIKIIGIGNPFRGDDGAGRAVARELASIRWPGVTVLEATGEGGALMDAWADADMVILIDAARAEGEPGTIYRFDARRDLPPSDFFNYSSHAFSVAEAVQLAHTLDQLPPTLLIYGIVGMTFEPGIGLSPAVEAAVNTVADRICADVLSHLPLGSLTFKKTKISFPNVPSSS